MLTRLRTVLAVAMLTVATYAAASSSNLALEGTALTINPSADLAAGGDTLIGVAGTALAGEQFRGAVGPGQGVRIMTGAVMPAGLDTVVPQEFTRAGPDGRICIPPGTVAAGDNRRLAGEDLARGEVAHEVLPGLAWCNAAGNVMGLYLHGLFEDEAALRALLGARARPLADVFDGLADLVEAHFAPGALAALAGP